MNKTIGIIAVFVLLASMAMADTAPSVRPSQPESNVGPDTMVRYNLPSPTPAPQPETNGGSGGGHRKKPSILVQSEPMMPRLEPYMGGWQCWTTWNVCFKVLS